MEGRIDALLQKANSLLVGKFSSLLLKKVAYCEKKASFLAIPVFSWMAQPNAFPALSLS